MSYPGQTLVSGFLWDEGKSLLSKSKLRWGCKSQIIILLLV